MTRADPSPTPPARSPLRRWLRGALWVGLLLMIALSALAGESIELYETELAVAGQDDAARSQAQRAALAEVVVRATGRRDLPDRPEVAALIEEAPRYVQQYRYLSAPPEEGGSLGGLRLWVRFDGAAVERQLQAAGIAVWGRLRPTLLAWVAFSGEEGRFLLGGEEGDALRQQFDLAARRRGTPLLFPLLDLEDQAHVHHADLWGGFSERALAHSKRYRPNGVLIVRIEPLQDGRWRGGVELHLEQPAGSWLVESATREQLISELVDQLADRLANHFSRPAAEAGSRQPVKLMVSGVTSLSDYARVERYLAALPAVSGLELVESRGDQLLFLVTPRSTPQGVVQAIALGHTLQPPPPGEGNGDEALSYRLGR